MITPRAPSSLRILWTDYWATMAAIFLFPFIALILIFEGLPLLLEPTTMVNTQNLVVLLALTAAWVFIFGGILAWRISVIRSVFNDGQELKGQITEVRFTRDRGLVKYTYTYMGTPYTASNRVMKNRRSQKLTPGSEAQVMVDTGDPRRAFLRDLYL